MSDCITVIESGSTCGSQHVLTAVQGTEHEQSGLVEEHVHALEAMLSEPYANLALHESHIDEMRQALEQTRQAAHEGLGENAYQSIRDSMDVTLQHLKRLLLLRGHVYRRRKRIARQSVANVVFKAMHQEKLQRCTDPVCCRLLCTDWSWSLPMFSPSLASRCLLAP